MKPSWISLFLGNTLYAVAAIEYIYITYLGFQALPFLQRQTAFLYPAFFVFVLYFSSLFGFNISQHVVDYFF
ncbi:Protein GMH1-like protein [Zancudomyces culisetae]|uniref:Protein GMH1-like protein n=1 Tax=Zancudomyces culisetae TaxID=1213189 RepID=A0A1R1PDI5_ZANCU|nr:Protein GMH1-like protein [Zancudomyces culisetae]|eukprot:OMH79037.1 Protein GMH1-like protein [Zancudomyces culisetae]